MLVLMCKNSKKEKKQWKKYKNTIRKNKINSQVLNNINESEKYTTIFCSGKNIVLKDEMYQLVKSKQLDLVVSNKDYVAKIKNEEINNKNNIDIKVEKNPSISIASLSLHSIVTLL